MINATLDNSPKPNTMNKIGRIAIGGISAIAVTKGEIPARKKGIAPVAIPTTNPIMALNTTPRPSRCRLAKVSAHSR